MKILLPEANPMRLRARHQGMTLVEVTIAIGIAAFAVMPIMGMLTLSMDAMTESSERALYSRLYAVAAEVARTDATQATATGWSRMLAFDRDLLPCPVGDERAHYALNILGSPALVSPVWNVDVTIRNAVKQQDIWRRQLILVQEPGFHDDEN